MSTKLVIGGMVSVPPTGGGATIPSTTNLIKGDGAGNGADSGINPDTVQTAPGLPAWTYTAGSLASGMFTTDNAAPGNTASITVSNTQKSGSDAAWIEQMKIGILLIFTNSAGVTNVFVIEDIPLTPSGGIQFTVGAIGASGSWSGDYQLSFAVYQIAGGAFLSVAQIQAMIDASVTAITLASLYAAAGITPVADGTVTPVTSITTNGGVVTAAS